MSKRLRKSDGNFVAADGLVRVVVSVPLDTMPTNSALTEYTNAPIAGKLVAAFLTALDALAANDTNYETFAITNLGQAGSGNTAMLGAVNGNTTKATGGTAIGANSKRALTLHGTAGNLVTAEGDRLRFTATPTGTLVNTVTKGVLTLVFERTS